MSIHENPDGSNTEGTKIEPNGRFVAHALNIGITSSSGIGARTALAAITPTASHIKTAQTFGRDASAMLSHLHAQIGDAAATLRTIIGDANPSDPNFAALNAVLASLA
jgi:hypothetical protein